jgi:quinol monooxygenase YgiN
MTRSILFVAMAGCLFLAGAPVGRTGEKDNPIIKLAKEKLSDPKKPFAMVVFLTAKEGEGKKLEELFKPAVEGSRKEKGCTAYDLNRDLQETSKYYVYERWQSLAALEAHMETSHIKALLSKIGDVVTGPPEAKFFAIAGE